MSWLRDQWRAVMFWLGLSFYQPRRDVRRHPVTTRKDHR